MMNKKLLLSIATVSIIFTGCNEDQEIEVKPKITVKKEEVNTVDKVANSVISHVESAANQVEKIAKDVQVSTAPVVKEIANKAKDVQNELSETTLNDAKEKIKEVTAPIIKKVQEVTKTTDASILYKKCSGCHGQNAEKKALNKSAVIKDWDASKIAEALNGYKNGTYGGPMKGLMVGQVRSLSADDIKAIADKIGK